MYVPLHTHSDYSLLDGLAKVKNIVSKCKELGIESCALTDHGTMGGTVSFYSECKKNSIKPIIGCEVYICDDRTDKAIKQSYHLILLAKNNIGYQNLVKLCSEAHLTGFYHKPRIDYDLLYQYAEGLICMSACLGGQLPKLLINDEYDKAEELVNWHKEVFGDDYYIEIQNHSIEIEDEARNKLIYIANEMDIKVVATSDSHYINKEDADAHELLLSMQMKQIYKSNDAYKFDGHGYHIHSYKEMQGLFDDKYLANTLEVADKCNVELDLSTNHYPVFPSDTNNKDLLLKNTIDGARVKYGDKSDEIKRTAWERIKYELEVIDKLGFNDYFLVVADLINYAKSVNIPVGIGRGSGAGSVVAYCCKITDICPIEYGLLFER